LLDYDVSADGTGQPGQGMETPTKEQAMAANRKRLYTQSMDGRSAQPSGGTFFSNISSTASNALAAMNKAARLNSPAPSSQPRRPGTVPPHSSQPMTGTREPFRLGSQQSMPSLSSQRSFDGSQDTTGGPQGASQGLDQLDGSQEPPRKRMKASSPSVPAFNVFSNGVQMQLNEYSQREGTPTEPSESFLYHQAADQLPRYDGDTVALPPLPHPGTPEAQAKQDLLLNLFADTHQTDFSDHPAITRLSGRDLEIPLDQTANTALHWAATLARVPLMRLLIAKGASIFRGNIAGETPLMAAVSVNNNLDKSCFPELLEILGPLIEYRDAKGRTILHHIAVTSGVKGRAASSKYYLEALLEFLVRSNSNSSTQATSSSFDGSSSQSAAKPIGLMSFMSEIVNARDMQGNTALNLVARIGNRSIIQQLLEVQADPTIPNYKGLKPLDFGVGGEPLGSSQNGQKALTDSPSQSKVATKADELSKEVVQSKFEYSAALVMARLSARWELEYIQEDIRDKTNDLTTDITNSLKDSMCQFDAEMLTLQQKIATHNATLRELSTTQKTLSDRLERVHSVMRTRAERKQKLQNLRRFVSDAKARMSMNHRIPDLSRVKVGDADKPFLLPEDVAPGVPQSPQMQLRSPDSGLPTPQGSHSSQQSQIPSAQILQTRLNAYTSLNSRLAAHLTSLKARDSELETKYRKVIALCTGVKAEDVDRMLPGLLAAVESEQGSTSGVNEDGGEVRVREFLRKVDEVGS
jgi:regulatory protein SWI6